MPPVSSPKYLPYIAELSFWKQLHGTEVCKPTDSRMNASAAKATPSVRAVTATMYICR